jgi:hypothetical protein
MFLSSGLALCRAFGAAAAIVSRWRRFSAAADDT